MMNFVHMNCFVSEAYPEIDYEPWLGPNWRKELSDHKKIIPTIITNHSSYLDFWVFLCSRFMPSYLANEKIRKSLIGKPCSALQSLYVNRREAKDQRDSTITAIVERQHRIQEGSFAQLVIFPEGTTSSNTHLISFKKGAFVSELPVLPIIFKYWGWPASPTMDCLDPLINIKLVCYGNLFSL